MHLNDPQTTKQAQDTDATRSAPAVPRPRLIHPWWLAVVAIGMFACDLPRSERAAGDSSLPAEIADTRPALAKADVGTEQGGDVAGDPSTLKSKTTATSNDLHATFDTILKQHVRDDRVDYLSIRKTHWRDLNGYLDQLAKADVAKLSRNDQLALYINLYNATMIKTVIERLTANYSPSDNRFRVFDEPLVRVGGKTMSLNHLEKKLIIPTFKEPRIHVALVCAAASCPPLIDRAYRGEDLNTVLTENMKRFVHDRSRNRIDVGRKRIYASKIFDWYAADFGGKSAIDNYIDRYHRANVTGYRVSFLEYSWELNIAKPKAGRWVRITRSGTLSTAPMSRQRAGTVNKDWLLEVVGEKDGQLELAIPMTDRTGWIRASHTAKW